MGLPGQASGKMAEDWPRFRLHCQGLDYNGWIYVNGHEVNAFRGSFVPHTFDLTPHLRTHKNLLQIIFDLSPRWLGNSATPPG